MPKINWDGHRDVLISAAQAAGRITLDFWGKNPKAWEKDHEAGPVSEADLASDMALKRQLMEDYPSYGWLSEETPDDHSRLENETVFVVDPLDGTREFLAGGPDFAVSVAVVHRNRVVAGVVHLPVHQVTYSATLEGDALCNGLVINASERNDLDGADILATRTSLTPEAWPGGLPEMTRSYSPSLAYRFCRVAEGRHDAMVTLRKTWEWDSAAGSLIADRAGCVVSDRWGAPLHFNMVNPQSDGVFVAPAPLYEALMHSALPKAY